MSFNNENLCPVDFFLKDDFRPYVSFVDRLKIRLKRRNDDYKIISLLQVQKFKNSDTIFLLGSGPSMLDITKEQWGLIKRHDSFGINYSFLLEHIPRFHHQETGRTKVSREFFKSVFSSRREKYHNSIWFVSSREYRRGLHPKYMPDFSPVNPICCFYKYPRPFEIRENRPFTFDDFRNSILYRGSLSLVLHLVYKLKYKNIILLGVELNNNDYFYDEFPEMKEYVLLAKKCYGKINHETHGTMIRKGNKYHTINEYLYALNDLVLKPQNINLYVGTKKSLLYPKLPLFDFNI